MSTSRLYGSAFPTSRRAFVLAASLVASAGAITVSSIAGAATGTSQDPTGEVVPRLAHPTAEPIITAPSTAVLPEQITPESEQPTTPVSEPSKSVGSEGVDDSQPAFDWEDGCPACGLG